jgi:hypothetical protein
VEQLEPPAPDPFDVVGRQAEHVRGHGGLADGCRDPRRDRRRAVPRSRAACARRTRA